MTLYSFRFFASLSSLLALTAACSAGPGSNADGGGDGSGSNAGDGSSSNGSDGNGSNPIDIDDIDDVAPEEDPDCDNILEMIVRDFDRDHPDFGGIPRADGGTDLFIGDEVRRQLVQPTLGANKKPVFLDPIGCAAPPESLSEPVDNCSNWTITQNTLTTAENFAEWYLDTPGKNISFDKTLELVDQGGGVYVFDTDAFFPLSVDEGFGAPMGDSADNISPGKNFLFTTEIHLLFQYIAGQEFTFRGDDDLWVFINGKLALDLGSMHAPREATIRFDDQAADLGISPGGTYAMDIFHAERRWNGSNFRIETNIACFIPVTEGIIR